MERAEIEAELVVVRESIEVMIERRPPGGFGTFDSRRYDALVSRETVLLELLRSEGL